MSWYKQMELVIREERPSDLKDISELIKISFKNKVTASLVNMLRQRPEYINKLSLVAEINDTISGYLLLSPVKLQTQHDLINTLWLEPVCVHPQYQRKGIGTAMINQALEMGMSLGYESVFVNGSSFYYSKFGFKLAKVYGIEPSIPVSSEVFLALELKENALKHQGKLIYPREIFD